MIGLVLLVVLSTVAFLEWNANRQHGAATTKLDQALRKEEGDLLTKPEVEKMIGRAEDRPGVDDGGGLLKVTYTWRGVVRKYPLAAFYTRQNPPKLMRIE